MTPRIDISAQNSFTIWESGSWDSSKKLGRSTLVADIEGEKLNVIFDTNVTNSNFHFLFFANIGQVIATAFIRQRKENEFQFDLELRRIESIATVPIQGNPVARANMTSLWMAKSVGPRDAYQMVSSAYTPDRIGYRKPYRDLVLCAIEKAFTKSDDQHLFWGIPRVARDN